jgi:biopolymer transport protein ExbD
MVSTVFAMPQAMEINLPPKEEKETEIKVKESNLLTIRVDDENRYWWNLKIPTPDNLPQLLPPNPNTPDSLGYQVWPDTLQGLLTNLNRENSSLSTLILISRDADYAQMVNILDEIDMIERSWNKYTADQLGVKVEDLTKEQGKFSYRYAIGDWETKDDRIIGAAIQAAQAKGEL